MNGWESMAKSQSGLALLALKIGVNQFDLNRGLAYISMRDQVIRARTLVHAAVAADLFDMHPENATSYADEAVRFDITVVGAGVGGVSIALAAAELGLQVLVLDKSHSCFSLLRSGTDRLLSATVYDWPAVHFADHSFPTHPRLRSGHDLPEGILHFPDKPVKAPELADFLQQQVEEAKGRYAGSLQFEHGIELGIKTGVTIADGRRLLVNLPRAIVISGEEQTKQIYTRIVVFAVGFGSEKTASNELGPSRSFWKYQDLEADLATSQDDQEPIHINGAGDGGLQEALRFALKPEYHDLAKAAQALDRHLEAHASAWERAKKTILVAEDNAARAFMWGYDPITVFSSLHATHNRVIDEMSEDDSCRESLKCWRIEVTREEPMRIRVYDPNSFSGRVYALNRFLFLLLTRQSGEAAVKVERVHGKLDEEMVGVTIDRIGVAQADFGYGVSSKEDFLRRTAFRALPNPYGAIV